MPIVNPIDFSKQFDIETFMDLVIQFLKDNLNTWIAKINTDKGAPALATVNDKAYFLETLGEEVVAFDPFVFIVNTSVDTDPKGPETAKSYIVDIGVIVSIGGDNNNAFAKRLLRYREVLERLFERGFDQVDRRLKLTVESRSPFPLEAVNSNKKYVATGISLGFTFA